MFLGRSGSFFCFSTLFYFKVIGKTSFKYLVIKDIDQQRSADLVPFVFFNIIFLQIFLFVFWSGLLIRNIFRQIGFRIWFKALKAQERTLLHKSIRLTDLIFISRRDNNFELYLGASIVIFYTIFDKPFITKID